MSGMVMALVYEDRIKSGLSFKSYLILRLGRIYPLHLFTLLLWLVYILFKQINGFQTEFILKDNIWTFVSNVFMIQSLGVHNSLSWNFPSWTISTEFYTYLLFYLLLITLDKKKKLWMPFLIAIISYCFLLSLNRITISSITYDFGIVRTIGAFYLGVGIYRFKRDTKFTLTKMMNLYELTPLLIFVFLISLPQRIPFHDIYMILTLVFSIYVFSEKKSGVLGNFLQNKILRKIGEYSYSIYMLHIFIISLYELVFRNVLGINMSSIRGIYSIILNGMFCITTILLSKYSYIYIEDYYRKKSKDYVRKKIMSK
jgi:peptidoglycan/LPS O-acetylase OafA/YrhL